jgi:hypothetical protein
MSANPNRRIGIGLIVLFLFAASYVHQPPSKCPTPLSRLDLLHALCSRGTLQIDAYDNTPDRAHFHGHFYSDKAPGTVVLALPAFAASATGLRAGGVGLDSERGWLVSSWVACAGSIAVITASGAACLFWWLCRYVPPRPALVTTLAIFLGAAPLPYATMMFSHSLVVACVAIALFAISNCAAHDGPSLAPDAIGNVAGPEHGEPRSDFRNALGASLLGRHRWELLAGFACGWAVASEYTAGLVIAGLFLWLISRGWRRAVPFCLAAIPPLLLIPLYSWLCFGNPFLLPYSFNESFPAMREGLYAIKWPDAETAYNLLFSPTRGLFFWTPFLAIALAGYWQLIISDKRLFWITYAVPLLQVLIISGRVWDWQAGPSLGPRYLAPTLPLLALPCALGVKRFLRIGACLASVSILLTTLATLVDAAPPGHIYNPLTALHLPALGRSEISPNLGILAALPPALSIAIYWLILTVGTVWLWLEADRLSPRSQ